MLTPAAPRAGPIGGAGLAFPAGIASLIIFVTFAAICGCERRFASPAAAAAAPADRSRNAVLELAPRGSGA